MAFTTKPISNLVIRKEINKLAFKERDREIIDYVFILHCLRKKEKRKMRWKMKILRFLFNMTVIFQRCMMCHLLMMWVLGDDIMEKVKYLEMSITRKINNLVRTQY